MIKYFCGPSQSQTKLGNLGMVGSTYPQTNGYRAGVCAPPLIFHTLQIRSSLVVTKLISNSFAPSRLRKKRAPVPRLLLCWVYVIGLGVYEKVQNTWEPMPNVFLGVDWIVFPALICFQILSPHPAPHRGSAVFLNIGLTQTCIAKAVPPPPRPTMELYQSTKSKAMKCKTNSNKQNFLKNEVIEYEKWASKWLDPLSYSITCKLTTKHFSV